MPNEPDIRSYTIAELKEMVDRGESLTDLVRVLAKTEQELEQDIAGDPESALEPADWYLHGKMVDYSPKRLLSLRLDADVVEWFRAQGRGYQTRMNAVLRAHVARETEAKDKRSP